LIWHSLRRGEARREHRMRWFNRKHPEESPSDL
jgi:hypothetical protein